MSSNSIPSLDLSFELVKNVLNDQSHQMEYLDNKSFNLFSVATVVLGIGISAGILSLEGEIVWYVYLFGSLSLLCYLLCVWFSYLSWELRGIVTLDNPKIIRESFWDLEPEKFKVELLSHYEDAYDSNEEHINKKAQYMKYQGASAVFVVSFIIATLVTSL